MEKKERVLLEFHSRILQKYEHQQQATMRKKVNFLFGRNSDEDKDKDREI